MSLDWSLVRSFHAVMEQGSLSAAARLLGISQPTVGRHIAELEQQLDAVLFERTGRLRATESAHALLAHAQDMQAAAERLRLQAAGQAETIAGSVRVTASEVVSNYHLPPIIARMSQSEPSIEIELVVSNTTENLLRRDADIALRMVEPTQSEVIARRIGGFEMGIFAHRDYLERAGTPTCVEDLMTHTFIGYDRSDLLLRGMRGLGLSASRSDFRIRTDNQIVQIEMMRAGVGIVAGQVSIADMVPGAVRIMPELPIPPLPLWLATHRQLRTSARVRLAFDMLAAELSSCVDA